MPLPFLDDMTEATRLTREGRLEEAMDLLRGHRAGASGVPPGAVPGGAPTIDLVPPAPGADGAWTAPPAGSSPSAADPLLGLGVGRWAARSAGGGLAGLGPASARTDSEVPVPPGALWEERVHANAAGSRAYKLYVPAGHRGRALPLVVMLHGCTQSPDDFARGTRMNELAEEMGVIVAYPQQSPAANAQRCWNWFSPADQARDRGEPAIVAGLTREVLRACAADPDRVYVAGLSAGGAAAAVLATAYPDLYAAAGVHSGLACGAARDVASAFAAMRGGAAAGGAPLRGAGGALVPTIVFHGDRDATVHPVNGDEVAAQAGAGAGLRRETHRGRSAGGLAFTRSVHLDPGGRPVLEQWVLHGMGHAWSGGSAAGSYTDPRGPDASREMLRFFAAQDGTSGRRR